MLVYLIPLWIFGYLVAVSYGFYLLLNGIDFLDRTYYKWKANKDKEQND